LSEVVTTGWPNGLLQDDPVCKPKKGNSARTLSQWFASKPDARRRAREAAELIKQEVAMRKFKSEWNKTDKDFTFPDGMPLELQQKVINRRRQIMTYGYLMFGLGEENVVGTGIWNRICRELQELQAAWGHNFNFYDWQFDDWDQTKEDHLLTNKGVDSGVMNQALQIMATKKAAARRLAERMQEEDIPY
jgi:hypothetical protein